MKCHWDRAEVAPNAGTFGADQPSFDWRAVAVAAALAFLMGRK